MRLYAISAEVVRLKVVRIRIQYNRSLILLRLM